MDREVNMPEVVVVTGASSEVGRATARIFGKHGARVGLLARNEDGLEGARRPLEDSYQPGNLFEPQSGDRGAHGRFDRQAHQRSLQLWATKNRRWLALSGTATVAAAALLERR